MQKLLAIFTSGSTMDNILIVAVINVTFKTEMRMRSSGFLSGYDLTIQKA